MIAAVELVPTPNLAEWLTAIGTVGATSIALILASREQIRAWFLGPRVHVALRPQPPDCQVIEAVEQFEGMGGFGGTTYNVFYSRLLIDNHGRSRAKAVGVRMTGLWRREQGAWVEDRDFLPMNLNWAHLAPRSEPDIDPHLPRHCDLCHFTEPYGDGAGTLMTLDTELQPNAVGENRWPAIKPPGEYQAEIAVTGANVRSSFWTLVIEFSGKWADSAEQIAREGLTVTVSRGRRPRG